jgi:RND family efflux transporter MFP subunit
MNNLILPKSTYSFTKGRLTMTISTLMMSALSYADSGKLVETATVKAWHNGATHQLHCRVQTPNIFHISSHNATRIQWLLPRGTQVSKGQLIAEQDGYYLETQINQLRIDRDSALAQQDYASDEYKRLQLLNKKNLVSPSRLNDMARLAKQAKLSKKLLETQLQEARFRQKKLQHFSPANGEIISNDTQPGEYLADGQNILKLQPLDNKELACELPLAKYRQNNQLQHASFTLNHDLHLTFIRKTQSLNENSQTLMVYLAPDSASAASLLIGERLQVEVSYQSTDITRIPYDSLELSSDGYYVWQLMSDKKVHRLPVNIVSTQSDYFLVKSTLQANDQVITFGKQDLADDQQVSLVTKGNHKQQGETL